MKVIHIFICFLMRVGKVFVQLLINDIPYMIPMVITYVGVRNYYKGQMWYT
jgi:hypothetical protein